MTRGIEGNSLVLRWNSNPVNDMIADALVHNAIAFETDSNRIPAANGDYEMLAKLLQSQFGDEITLGENSILVRVDGSEAVVDLKSMEVACENEQLQQQLADAVSRLASTLFPIH